MSTAVIYNRTDPDSKRLAEYYAEKRGIPSTNLIGLLCPQKEQISRAQYEATIAQAIRSELHQRGLTRFDQDTARLLFTKIRYFAVIRGVPLKITADKTATPAENQPDPIRARSEAAVDSELAVLGLGRLPISGVIENSYYRRFTPIVDDQQARGLFAVARLDGPTPAIVRGMIDASLAAERDGLWGWAFVDQRGISSGGYALGDKWLQSAVEAMRKQGIPTWVDRRSETIPAGFPITDLAVYYGWYAGRVNGPFANPNLRFRPGAIAVHIHSFSAATLRNLSANWCAPLLARGAAATLGNVYEPYLALTADLSVFQDRLMAGMTLAESALMATRALSWMGTVIGDPLYRPYAQWHSQANRGAFLSSWQRYRAIVRDAGGNVLAAAPALRIAAQKSSNPMFLEALAAAQFDAGEKSAGIASLDSAVKLSPSRAQLRRILYTRFRQGAKAERESALEQLSATSVSDAVPDPLVKALSPPPPNPSAKADKK